MELKIILILGLAVAASTLLFGYLYRYSDRMLREDLAALIERAGQLGLPEADVAISTDYLEHTEYGLCADHLVVQMYEYSIAIDQDFYDLLCKIGERIDLSRGDFDHMKELIR